MINPLFSIIMPAYNAEATLRESLNSVLSQSFHNFELIVVDDCSTDDTKKIIETFVYDNRVRPIFLHKNIGVSGARNLAIKRAKGRYITFLDSDDIWLKEKLEKQKAHLEESSIVFSNYYRFDNNGDKGIVRAKQFVSYKDMLKKNWIGNLTGSYDCYVLGKVYQKPIGHEDYLMWLELVRKAGYAKGINEVLAGYRVSSSSLSGNKLKSASWVWSIYRRHLGLNLFESIRYFFFYVFYNVVKRI